ncbi:hypothetical protein Cni_G03796 [Canna indica]|uniref:Glycosyltransferases n=1 Tax=Canna indica TaxID=4628 RepID=A0AAQ3JRV9_9LILI|nr:hypothetical protein Cni_G03796 [Canna indica]
MKQSEPQHPNRRASNAAAAAGAFRSSSAVEGVAALDGAALKYPGFLFSPAVHVLCCLLSAAAGFRFSRLIFLLFFSPSPPSSLLNHYNVPFLRQAPAAVLPPPSPIAPSSRVVVGRHGIRVRPWPHPDPAELGRANEILARVQQEQRLQYGVKDPRPVLVVTPTYARTFQALHLTGLAHSLMLVPYPITWLVVEAGGPSNQTAALLARSRLHVIHLPFHEKMPVLWSDRHRFEARMRLHALRLIREQRLEGLVLFADDSNVHSTELFDEIQILEWMGALSIGMLSHSAATDTEPRRQQRETDKENSPLPIQGPACNSSGHLIGWHTFNSLPLGHNDATFVGDGATGLPIKLEWAGFVLNSRLLWKDAEGKPDWVRDLDEVGIGGEEMESPLDLLKDASFVEPIGDCGKKVLLWWLRAEARYDSKFPTGWVIDPSPEIVVPAKQTPLAQAPPDIPIKKTASDEVHVEERVSKKGRSSRSKRNSCNKKKHEQHAEAKCQTS